MKCVSMLLTSSVSPKVGETTGSLIGNILGAGLSGYAGTSYYSSRTYEFKADLRDAAIYVNGKESPEIQRGMVFQPLNFWQADYWGTYKGSDLAQAGVFICSYDMFSPTNGIWPKIDLKIVDLKKPDKPLFVTIPRETVEQVWLDFEPFREQINADKTELVVGR